MPMRSDTPPDVRSLLLIDATGRGHALADCLTRSDPGITVFYAPGTALVAAPRIVPVPGADLADPDGLATLCGRIRPDLVMVSHIDALSRGAVDAIRARGFPTVGPTQAAARLEGSKSVMKEFCARHGLPTARGRAFDDREAAKAHARRAAYPHLVKADGLCDRGDGAVICRDAREALAAIDRLADRELFGDAGRRVILEEYLEGPELSFFALLCGDTAAIFATALDYKRRGDGDRGPNCDGMGSVSPHPLESSELTDMLDRLILRPFLAGLRRDALDYTGFVYFGLSLTRQGPKILEINVRFGDSEAETVFPRLRSPLAPMLARAARRCPIPDPPVFYDDVCVSVALIQGPVPGEAGPGWPDRPTQGGQEITGLRRAVAPDSRLFIANIATDQRGRPLTSGGRVLHATGFGADYDAARQAAYRAALQVQFCGKSLRTDIARGLSASTLQPSALLVPG